MRKLISAIVATVLCACAYAQTTVTGPDGKLKVNVTASGKYSVVFDGITVLEPSALGFVANSGDYTTLEMTGAQTSAVSEQYSMSTIKASKIDYKATKAIVSFKNAKGQKLDVEFRVSNNDVAFRYVLPKEGARGGVRIMEEESAFKFPQGTLTYLTPQSDAMIGFARTKPSYEEFYYLEKPLTEKSEYGHGYTFPCLFKISEDAWALVSETGVDSHYCASHLSDWDASKGYTIAFPLPEENDGNGTVEPAFAVPGATPWRTITVGHDLKPIAETTVAWDLVEEKYPAGAKFRYGRSSWSWILWQDASINWDDLTAFIELSNAMHFEYTLVDAGWDKNLGREMTKELVRYANSINIDVILWYASGGYWNDIPQTPRSVMTDAITRKQEMAWLKSIGVKGIKVDFFGGEKQETMRLYEEILSDANDYGLVVIFHGCTLPRGWERMYPNFVGSEATRASENMVFNQNDCDLEPEFTTLHPFIRNSIASMEFGGCFLNRRLSRNPERGTRRITTDVFEIATEVLFQNPIQNIALAPNNLTDGTSEVCLDFLREVPSTWDETRFVDGYPGKYVIMARRKGAKWYIAATNGTLDKPLKVDFAKILQQLGIQASCLQLYTGGNNAVVSNQLPKKALTVAAADAAVLVVETSAE